MVQLHTGFALLILCAACGSDSNLGPNGDKADELGESCEADKQCGANLNLFCHERICTAFVPASDPHQTGELSPPAYFGDSTDKDGRDEDDFRTGIFGMHTVLLRTGKVLLFAGHGFTVSRYPLESITWDPATEEVERQSYDTDIFCAHHTFLANGEVLIAGGGALPLPLLEKRVTWRFDPLSEQWTEVGPMEFPRWYPTMLTLPDGRTLVASGTEDAIPMEVFDPGSNAWRTLLGDSPFLPELYPGLQVLPNNPSNASDGDVVLYNPSVGWDFPAPTGAMLTLDTSNNDRVSMTQAAAPNFHHENGDVTFHVDDSRSPAGATMRVFGGGIVDARGLTQLDENGDAPESDRVEELDLTAPDSSNLNWQELSPMRHVRANVSAVPLPDGTIWAVGGQTGGQWNSELAENDEFEIQYIYETELYDPRTNNWSRTKSLMHPRQYHHTATLLPDGRVLVTGGQDPTLAGKTFGGKERDIRSYEIFSPPYLFNPDGTDAARPEIRSAPSSIQYGEDFNIAVDQVTSARPITAVVLITPNSETHHTSTGRVITLEHEDLGDKSNYRVRAPSTGKVAPPTHYMLFAVDSEGVPSTAQFVRVF